MLGTGPLNEFDLGTLSFTNGIWTAPDASFGFTLKTHSSLAAFDNKTLSDTLVMRVTPNNFINGTALANSDFVYFSGTPIIGSIRAYELRDTPTGTNKVTATVKGYIDSLHLSAFSDVSGGFFDPGIALAPTAVPEPPTYAMMLAGLGLIVFIRSRKKQNAI